MFNSISRTYDFLNRALSLGIDKIWRKKVISYIPQKEDVSLLDLATGTGDLLIQLVQDARIVKAYGLDLSQKMLSVFEKKIKASSFLQNKEIHIVHADMQKLPFGANQFDMATMAFGIRNVPDPESALKQTYKVLKKGGVLVVLELSIPKNRFIRFFYLLYFRFLLPVLGGLISGNFSAYFYLNQTVEKFPQGEDFCDLLISSGFKNPVYRHFNLGIVTLYSAYKN